MPYAWFSFEVPGPADVVTERLRAATGPHGSRIMTLCGYVYEGSFELQRAIHYRNSFLPRMEGTLESDGSVTRVRGTMTMHPLVAGFLVLWLVCVTFVGLVALDPATAFAGDRTGPFWMIGFGVLLALGGFGIEVVPSRRALEAAARG